MVTATQKIKALLHLKKDERKLDLEIAKMLGWSYLTNEKTELGDWVGLSPSDQIEVIPFFTQDANESQKLINFLIKKFPNLEYIPNGFPADNIFTFEWNFTKKSGHKNRIYYAENENETLGLIKSVLHVYQFLNG
jgi:hypothetical protein